MVPSLPKGVSIRGFGVPGTTIKMPEETWRPQSPNLYFFLPTENLILRATGAEFIRGFEKECPSYRDILAASESLGRTRS